VFRSEFTKMCRLLLRGLFAAGVLEFVFAKKKWRVNHGLDSSRSMLAVPYHAKDNVSKTPGSRFSKYCGVWPSRCRQGSRTTVNFERT
jgi:hypothetical protein